MLKHHILHLSLALTALFVSVACSHHEHLPDGIMDSATMTDFLTDAYLVEGYYNTVSFSDRDSLTLQLKNVYNSLYDKYHITPELYDSSLNYYTHNPKLFEDIYRRVRDNIQEMKNGNEIK